MNHGHYRNNRAYGLARFGFFLFLVYVASYPPSDPNKGDLLAAAVVDQRHAHVLYRQDDFLFSQLRFLALTELLVDSLLLSEQHNALETFGSTLNPNHDDLTLYLFTIRKKSVSETTLCVKAGSNSMIHYFIHQAHTNLARHFIFCKLNFSDHSNSYCMSLVHGNTH